MGHGARAASTERGAGSAVPAVHRASETRGSAIAFDIVETPVGPLLLAVSARGLCRVSFDAGRSAAELEAVEHRPAVRDARPVGPAARQILEYLDGRRREFELDIDIGMLGAFGQAVLGALATVPYGTTTTYGALASRLGRPRASRAVGGALNRNPVPIVIPCHRVLGAGGQLVGFAGGIERKLALLEIEGVQLPL